MTEVLPSLEIDARGKAAGTIIWLHGLGANGHDFEPIVPHLGLSGVRFVFPHAPVRPVTINGGFVMPAWYDILAMGTQGGENGDDVRESAAQIEDLIAREAARGVPSERIVLAGFSQGGAMALFAGLRHAHPLRGIMVLSGYEVLSRARDEVGAANRETPLLFCHGTHDPMVDVARARAAFAAYREGRPDAQWHEFPMGHEVSPAEIAVIRDWLGARFAAAD